MADTPTTSLRARNQVLASNQNVWGDPYINTNNSIFDAGVTRIATLTCTGATYTLSATDYDSNAEAIAAGLLVTGALGSGLTIVAPARRKITLLRNDATGGQTTTWGVSGGVAVTIPQTGRFFAYTDGTDAFQVTPTYTTSGRIVGLTDPSAAQDAATKAYVDAATGGTGFTGSGAVVRQEHPIIDDATFSGTINQTGTFSGGAYRGPTIITGTLSGSTTAGTVNLLTIQTLSGTLGVFGGKTLRSNQTITFSGGDGAEFDIAASKTVIINNSLSLQGTDGTNFIYPTTSGRLMTLDQRSQSFSGGVTIISYSGGTFTGNAGGGNVVNPGNGPLQYFGNAGAHQVIAPAADGSCVVLYTNLSTAGAYTFSGFTVGSSVGDATTTTSGNKFKFYIDRVAGISSYTVQALQ